MFFDLATKHQLLIWALAKREVSSQYIGSLLGILWAFIHPLTMILVFWFIFSVGFRVKPLNDVPFVVWLTAGMAPWFYFAGIINGSVSVVVANANLVKKTIFPSEVLPVVKIISNLVTHAFFVLLLLILIFFYQLEISFSYFQVIYYLVCLWVLALGFSWAVAAINVFIRDVNHLVAIIIQVGFWATPIFWDITMMPDHVLVFQSAIVVHGGKNLPEIKTAVCRCFIII
jgi:lipopolysaccharide transport system permease protein/teichoic acid transport system permease protein